MPNVWSELNWPQIEQLAAADATVILPTGAVEAHGPHLPVSTDRIIALAMAEAGADELADRGIDSVVLPPLDFTSAAFAAGFAGTISISRSTATALIVDIARSLAAQGFQRLVIANAHFDPGHLGSIYDAIARLADDDLEIIFPDVTRRPWANRLTDEFKSGACHAGRYESSVVLARRPELVDEATSHQLTDNPRSLSTAIRDGLTSFEQAGGPKAYFGDPAAASAEEGRQTIKILGRILAEAVAG